MVLVVRIIPLFIDHYRQGQDYLAVLDTRIERYQGLIEEQSQLVERQAEKLEEIDQLENWSFVGATPNLIGSSVQRELRRAVSVSNVTVREMSVAEYSSIDGWLLVSQEMTFTIEQKDMLTFLNLLAESMPRLHVTDFSITRGRRQFTGSLTVIAFSRNAEFEGQG